MKNRQCPECGNELQEQAVFCTTCGRDLASLNSARRHRLLLFGTPLALLVIGIALAWDMGWESPADTGSDFGMILGLFYIGGAVGQWLSAVFAGRDPDSVSSWRGGVYAVVLLPVVLLLSMPIEEYLIGDGYPNVSLADEPYLKLGIKFTIYIAMYIFGVLGALARLPRAAAMPVDGADATLAVVNPDDGVAVLIGGGVKPLPESRLPGMARLVGVSLCVAALCMGALPASSRLVVQARFASMLGRPELALSWAKEALKKNPGDASAYHLAGLLMLARERSADGREEALAYLRKAVQTAPRSARYHLALGIELNRLGLASEAAKAASEAVALHPREYQLWLTLGDILAAQGGRNEAVDAYRKALDLEPRDPVVANNLAFVLLELDRELPLALELARTSIELQPGYVYNLDTLAWALYKNGRLNEALEAMLQIKEAVATPSVEIEFHNAVICKGLDLLQSPRDVFLRLAARPDVDAVPGLRDQIASWLASLPVKAETEGISEPASAAITPPDGEGR